MGRWEERAVWCLTGLLLAAAGLAKNPKPAPVVTFTDVTEQAGIRWRHINGATPEKYLIETMGGGGAFLDYNRDGRLDIFLVQSGCRKHSVNCTPGKNALYRQNADGTFTDVAEKAGLTASSRSTSAAFFDYNPDGYPDLYVARYLDWDYSKNIFCGEKRLHPPKSSGR